MTWEKIANDHSSLQEYRFVDKKGETIILKFNPLHQSARVTFNNSHRLFFMESAGAFSGKTVFTNEYGLETGYLSFNTPANKGGNLLIDDKQYHFKIIENELTVFENNGQPPLGVFELPASATVHSKIDRLCYILGACWYLFLPFTKRVTIQYATAS